MSSTRMFSMPQARTCEEILPFKQELVAVVEQTVASAHQSSQTQGLHTRLVGEINETDVLINGLQAKGLIDTGATVSTLSKDFHQKHLKAFQLCSLSPVLDIECVDGEQLSYTVYIEVDIGMIMWRQGISGTNPILVVPATPYNRNVLLLLGTHLICMTK